MGGIVRPLVNEVAEGFLNAFGELLAFCRRAAREDLPGVFANLLPRRLLFGTLCRANGVVANDRLEGAKTLADEEVVPVIGAA